jgi:hypothetical protein
MATAHVRQRNAGRFGFGTSNGSATTASAFEVDGQMAAQATGLRMFTAQQPALRHCGATDARTQCDHDYIIALLCCSGVPFAEKGEAGIVLYLYGKIQFFTTPRHQVQARRIVEFGVGGKNTAARVIHEATETEGHTGQVGAAYLASNSV